MHDHIRKAGKFAIVLVLKLIKESLIFALTALRSNLLRTTLSLLGVTIGIFAIIAVFTLVDSLEKSINESLSFLGRTNVDIRRFPFEFGPNVPWWDYIKRPYSTYEEYDYIRDKIQNAEAVTIFAFKEITPKYKNSSSSSISLLGISYGHQEVYNDFKDLTGRYFTVQEFEAGRNVAIIGNRSRTELFGTADPIGKQIKIKGSKFTVVGVIEEQGAGLFGETSKDENIYIPFRAFTKINYVGRRGIEPLITVKGFESDIGLVKLEYELQGLVRKARGLRPKEKDNFSIVRQQAILNSIGSFFDVLGVGGWLIGGFSILIGGFGIANIMFVSVRERTNIIGIQKSLGAKNYFILFQFLFESIFLSVIGGGVGLLLVFAVTFIDLGSLDLALSFQNIVLGVGVAATIGMISGIVPAALAARMDPVEAIRTQ